MVKKARKPRDRVNGGKTKTTKTKQESLLDQKIKLEGPMSKTIGEYMGPRL